MDHFVSKLEQAESEAPTVDLAPMLDVVFILLIFFVVLLAVSSAGVLEVEASGAAQTTKESLDVFLKVDGQVVIRDRAMAIEDVGGELGSAVHIVSDAAVRVDTLNQLMAKLQALGAENLTISVGASEG